MKYPFSLDSIQTVRVRRSFSKLDGWCFAIVNGKLAEIYYGRKQTRPRIFAHCYVRYRDFWTKREQQEIREDVTQCQFVYRKGLYQRVKNFRNAFDEILKK